MGDPPVKDETAGGGEKESTPSPPPALLGRPCPRGPGPPAAVLRMQSCDLPGELSSLIGETARGAVTDVVSLSTLQAAKRHPRQAARGTVMNLMNLWEEMAKREPSSDPGAISAGERGSSPQGGQE